MSYYFIVQINIHDCAEYQKYLDYCDRVFEKYNGKYLAVDGNPTILEGKWEYTRVVLIQFPSEEDFYRWYSSPEYQEILQYRLTGAKCDSILVKGLADS